MEKGGFVSWDNFPIVHNMGCPCCMGVILMPTEEEIEQRITEHIDRESLQNAILGIELETLRKGIDKIENVSGLHASTAGKQTD